MDILAPVSAIMTKNLVTIGPGEDLLAVRDIFEKHKIHHIPVVRFKNIIGMISKSDFMHFMRGYTHDQNQDHLIESRLKTYRVEDIMTKNLAKVEPDDRINVALEVFRENLFHAIPVVENDKLVGIVTTYDIINALASEGEKAQ